MRNTHCTFPKPISKKTINFVNIRIKAGKEYEEKFGEIKDIKHFQKFMRKREIELTRNKYL